MPLFNPMIPEQQAWQSPTLQNYWVHWGTGASVPGYYKDSLGNVHLRGLLRSGTIGQAMFTLPAGYRPEFRMVFPAVSATTGSAALTLTRADVATDGQVIAVAGGTEYFSLDGITFRAT
jgi:hypothetical protein